MPTAAPFAFLAKQPGHVHLWFLGSHNKTVPHLVNTPVSHNHTFPHPPKALGSALSHQITAQLL